MRNRLRISVLWMAAAFVLLSSAFGFAATGSNHGSDVSKVAKPTASPGGTHHGDEVSDAAKKDKDENEGSETHERKHNHGFFVSQAAHCEDVSDPDTPDSPTFKAPADCKGAGHGEYVSSVAHSSLGKPEKGNGKPE
jgi:hypothetical protein